MRCEFPGSSFHFICLRCQDRESNNIEMSTSTKQNNNRKHQRFCLFACLFVYPQTKMHQSTRADYFQSTVKAHKPGLTPAHSKDRTQVPSIGGLSSHFDGVQMAGKKTWLSSPAELDVSVFGISMGRLSSHLLGSHAPPLSDGARVRRVQKT